MEEPQRMWNAQKAAPLSGHLGTGAVHPPDQVSDGALYKTGENRLRSTSEGKTMGSWVQL